MKPVNKSEVVWLCSRQEQRRYKRKRNYKRRGSVLSIRVCKRRMSRLRRHYFKHTGLQTAHLIDDLSEKANQILGTYGYNRFQEFRNEYKDGWDFGQGQSLSKDSIANFDFFLNNFSNFPTEPSIFLTRSGHLQLIWEDKYNDEVLIEFSPTGFTYYIARLNEEGEINRDAINELIAKIGQI